VNPYMFTIVKAVKKLTFNSCILYFIFLGETIHNRSVLQLQLRIRFQKSKLKPITNYCISWS